MTDPNLITINCYHLAWWLFGMFSFGYVLGIIAEKTTPKDGVNLHKKK